MCDEMTEPFAEQFERMRNERDVYRKALERAGYTFEGEVPAPPLGNNYLISRAIELHLKCRLIPEQIVPALEDKAYFRGLESGKKRQVEKHTVFCPFCNAELGVFADLEKAKQCVTDHDCPGGFISREESDGEREAAFQRGFHKGMLNGMQQMMETAERAVKRQYDEFRKSIIEEMKGQVP
jgi:hypothetical protein